MKVAIFTESYEPIVNGVSVSIATLRDGLRSRGHEVRVFAPRFPGHEDAVGTHRFPAGMSRFAPGYPIPFPYSTRVWKEFEAYAPDIVHTHTPFILGSTGMSWARRLRIPVVSTNHTLYTEYTHYFPFAPKSLTSAALVFLMRWYYSKCDAVVVPSKPVEGVLRGYGIKTRIEVIKSGVTNRRRDDRSGFRSEFSVPDDVFLMLYVGRVAKEKNLGLLLDAFMTVHASHPSTRLMIVGSGPDEQSCRTRAGELGISDFVHFTGMLGRSEVERAYSAADLFAFPSVTETQGLVICEALTAGLPCVAVRAAATPEVIQDGTDGLLTPNTPDGFAEGVIRLIRDDALRARLSEGALANASSFSPDAMANQFECFYKSIIGGVKSEALPVGGSH